MAISKLSLMKMALNKLNLILKMNNLMKYQNIKIKLKYKNKNGLII
jgi:hypothetical protein